MTNREATMIEALVNDYGFSVWTKADKTAIFNVLKIKGLTRGKQFYTLSSCPNRINPRRLNKDDIHIQGCLIDYIKEIPIK